MADGLGDTRAPDDFDDRGVVAGVLARRVGLGLALALVLIVLIAGAVGNLLPGGGGPVADPGPAPTLMIPGPGMTTVPSPEPTQSGTGQGNNPSNPGNGNDPNNPGNGNPNANPDNNGNPKPTKPPKPTPTPTPTPTPSPTPSQTLPPVGPDRCTVPGGPAGPPNYCVTRQQVLATVLPGRMSVLNGAGLDLDRGSATKVPLRIGNALYGQPSITGQVAPVTVTDMRGSNEGWALIGSLALTTSMPPGVVMTIDPWCAPIADDSAPGLIAGPSGQDLSEPILLCQKDQTVGPTGSTGGRYNVGGTVSVSSWRGTPIPVSALLLSLTLS